MISVLLFSFIGYVTGKPLSLPTMHLYKVAWSVQELVNMVAAREWVWLCVLAMRICYGEGAVHVCRLRRKEGVPVYVGVLMVCVCVKK